MGLASPIDVDFEKEMLILYVQPTNTPHLHEEEYALETATLSEGLLTVKVKDLYPSLDGYMDACNPYALCVVLKMKKTEITAVIFKGIGMSYALDYAIPLP